MTGDQRTYWDNTNKELTSFKIAFFLRFGCPSTSLVLQYGNFVPREPLAVNNLFMGQVSAKICCCKAFDVTCSQPLPSPHKQRWRRFKTEITGITNIPSLSQGLLSSIVGSQHRASRASLAEEEKRRFCLNHVKPLMSPQSKLLD